MKVGLLAFLAVIILGANIFAWASYFKKPSSQPSVSSTVILNSTSITPTSVPTIEETSLIKEAIFELTGLDGEKAEIFINQNTGQHAKGQVKEFEAVGGAYWLAAKVNGNWVGVYAGQANPQCSQIAPFSFPKEMVSECLDENGKLVGR